MTARKPSLTNLLRAYSDACISLAWVQEEWNNYNVPYEDLKIAKQREKNSRKAIIMFVDALKEK